MTSYTSLCQIRTNTASKVLVLSNVRNEKQDPGENKA